MAEAKKLVDGKEVTVEFLANFRGYVKGDIATFRGKENIALVEELKKKEIVK